MRILLIAQFGKYGGTREAFKRILHVHQKNGLETHAIIDHNSDEEIKKYIIQQGANYTQLTKRGRLFNNMMSSLTYEHSNYKTILKDWKPDLIVASIGTSNLSLYPFLRQYPMVYILHTIPIEFNIHLRWFYKIFSFLADKNQLICGVSNATIDSVVRNWGYDRNKTAVIHNTFNESHVRSGNDKHETSQLTVLTLGHVEWYKNPELWLQVAEEVVKKYEHIKFIWLGDGKLFSKFREKTKHDPQIHFPGFKQNVTDYYSKASIYFQPSIKENHSFSVLDAMANGLPCVLSNVGGLPESIKDGVYGYLCKPDDSKLFVDRLSMLIENPELRTRLGEQAKVRAYTEFHPKNYGEKLLKLYNRALNGKE